MNKEITIIELLNRIEDKTLKNGTKIIARKNLSYLWFVYEEDNTDYIESQLLKVINLVGIKGSVILEDEKSKTKNIDKKTNKEIMGFALELAKQGIDLEKLIKDLEPIFNICKQVAELGIKNYEFLMKGNKNE